MKANWRTTDNRHWDSPARMSDGRSLTTYQTAAIRAAQIQDRIGISKQTMEYNEYLQKHANKLVKEYEQTLFLKNVVQDPWTLMFAPPQPSAVIETGLTKHGRGSMRITETNARNGIGVQTTPIQDNTKEATVKVPISDYSANTGAIDLDDPRWGISPDTLVLTKRDASAQGGRVWGWLHSNDNA